MARLCPYRGSLLRRFFEPTHAREGSGTVFGADSRSLETWRDRPRIPVSPANSVPSFEPSEPAKFAHAVVRGDEEAISALQQNLDWKEGSYTFFPASTITIELRRVAVADT